MGSNTVGEITLDPPHAIVGRLAIEFRFQISGRLISLFLATSAVIRDVLGCEIWYDLRGRLARASNNLGGDMLNCDWYIRVLKSRM